LKSKKAWPKELYDFEMKKALTYSIRHRKKPRVYPASSKGPDPFILDSRTVALVLKMGGDPNSQNEDGMTPLHCVLELYLDIKNLKPGKKDNTKTRAQLGDEARNQISSHAHKQPSNDAHKQLSEDTREQLSDDAGTQPDHEA
jgi:hypothetical protein